MRSLLPVLTKSIPALLLIVLCSCSMQNNKLYLENGGEEGMELLAVNRLSEAERRLFTVPYKLNEPLRQLAAELKDPALSPKNQSRKIVNYLLRQGTSGLGIEYSLHSNFTAEEVYQHRRANCIAYTNLFIGLAREMGLKANYVEVTGVEAFRKVNGTVVYNNHICAAVFWGAEPSIVDFTLGAIPEYQKWRTISDLEATASFYNNVGSSVMVTSTDPDRLHLAEQYYTISQKIDPDFAPTYINLGVLAQKRGTLKVAESYYYRSLQLDPSNFAACQNLSTLLLQQNRLAEALLLLQETVRQAPENQFARVSLARLSIMAKEYGAAECNLKSALRIDSELSEANRELGRLYFLQGKRELARKELLEALDKNSADRVARQLLTQLDKPNQDGVSPPASMH